MDGMGAREAYREVIFENIGYEYLIQDPKMDREQLDEIAELIVDHLKNAEMQLEDDYGMIDGVINNGPKESVKPAPKKEEVKTKKPSVLAKLRKYQEEDRKSATQHRSAERDL